MTSIVTTPVTTGRVIWRYATLGGATVAVTRHHDEACAAEDYCGRPVVEDCRWRCLGCGAGSEYVDEESTCQVQAGNHSAKCRSMPLDDEAADELAAIRAEVAGARRELADVAAQLRGLNITLAEAGIALAAGARALPDIAQAVSDLPDSGEYLSDIATAVESLAANLERPRLRWFRRASKCGDIGTTTMSADPPEPPPSAPATAPVPPAAGGR